MVDLKEIKAFAFDIDGIFTDGGIYATGNDLLRRFESKDCFGVRMASMHGYPMGIITGGISHTIPHRMMHCGISPDDVYLGSRDKMEELDKFCKRHGLAFSQVLYCGDDLPDIPPIKACGIGACPADAVQEVKDAADFVSEHSGGHQFVRYIIEMVMRAHNTWFLDVDDYKEKF